MVHPKYMHDFQNYINKVTAKLLCNSTKIYDNKELYDITPNEILDNLDFFADKMDNNITVDIALSLFKNKRK